MDANEISAAAQELLNLRDKPKDLIEALRRSPSEVLYAVMPKTAGYTGPIGAEYSVVREAALAMLQERSVDKLIETMRELDHSATLLTEKLSNSARFLSGVGIALAAVIGIAQIAVPLIVGHRPETPPSTPVTRPVLIEPSRPAPSRSPAPRVTVIVPRQISTPASKSP